MLAQHWLKHLVQHRPTTWVVFCQKCPNAVSLTPLDDAAATQCTPIPGFWRLSKKLFDLEDTYWNSFCTARYFSWNIISQRAWCIWRALWDTVWHSGTNESLLLCGSYIISRLRFLDQLLEGFDGRSLWYTRPYTEPTSFLPFSQKLLLAKSSPYMFPCKIFQVHLAKISPPCPASASKPCCFGSGAEPR